MRCIRKMLKISKKVFSKREIKDLSKAWIILSLAFAIVFYGANFDYGFILAFLVSAITVGTAFIFHEMGHKIVAQHYGCFAEFRSFDNMLFLALIMSFFGFVFAAPGAVMIAGPVGTKRNGLISLAGPGMNVILAFLFLAFGLLFGNSVIIFYGFLINSWIGLFNMIPFGNFDGIKILRWNKLVYGLMVFVCFVLVGMQNLLIG